MDLDTALILDAHFESQAVEEALLAFYAFLGCFVVELVSLAALTMISLLNIEVSIRTQNTFLACGVIMGFSWARNTFLLLKGVKFT